MILDTPFRGSLRRQYDEARALELLVLSLHACSEHERSPEDRLHGISARDVAMMQKARTVLEEQYDSPPTISALAREIGLNEAKLMQDFKQLFGQTIFDFTQNIRMDKAKKLLETSDKSITEIAFEVGYEYSSNFTTAFKRRFGVPPLGGQGCLSDPESVGNRNRFTSDSISPRLVQGNCAAALQTGARTIGCQHAEHVQCRHCGRI